MMKTRAQRFTERTSAVLARRVGRRGFIVRAAIAGSAMMVDPLRYLLRPGSAYAAVCGPGADCASGWTVMCCSINRGINQCPPGSIPAGWWKADNSGFCGGGPRYYIDCNASCGACGCDTSGVCAPNCQNCTARCNTGTCDQRRVCWNQFRYGQCHQEIRCVGAVVCRQVSCTPPWQVDPTCSQLALTNNATALHDAPCLHQPGAVFAFGHAPFEGAPAFTLNAPLVGIAATPSGTGYWLVASDGGIFTFGDAQFHGSAGGLPLNRPVVGMAASPDGGGYWLTATDGGIFDYGNALFSGSEGGVVLNKPVVGIASAS